MGSFPAAIVMGFMNYVKFSGFASRAEYWYWILFSFLGSLLFAAIDIAVFGLREASPAPFSLVFGLATLLPSLTVTVRRLHDAGYSGLSYFWNFLPIVGPFIVLYRLLQPTQHLAADRYGYTV